MNNQSNYWPLPKSRSLGFFSEARIFYEVLYYASKNSSFTKKDLQNLLSDRVSGLLFLKNISDTAIENLVRELLFFKWIQPFNKLNKEVNISDGNIKVAMLSNLYQITETGRNILVSNKYSSREFYTLIITKLHELYVIPGWFLQRLWDINPSGQGEIVIPAPSKEWDPENKSWEDKIFHKEFEIEIRKSYTVIQDLLPQSLNFDLKIFLALVEQKWNRLSNQSGRRKGESAAKQFTPRKRLAMAMKEASIELMFGNKNPKSLVNDFDSTKPPLIQRSFFGWCVRLEELGLIYYTDYHPRIPGKLIFPNSLFKDTPSILNFDIVPHINNPQGKILCIFNPSWESFSHRFLDVLYTQYRRIYIVIKSMYISVQDLRDEVCRILRISSSTFNELLECAIKETNTIKNKYRIALETDIREDQRSAVHRQRKPVYVLNNLVTLIAITINN